MILVDSSVIVAYSNVNDVNHQKALRVVEEVDKGVYGKPVITDHIFGEVVTVALMKTKNLQKVVTLGEKLLDSTEMVRIDELSFDLAWRFFKEQRDAMFSFTDCTSLAVARVRGITNIATFDADFQEAKGIKVIN